MINFLMFIFFILFGGKKLHGHFFFKKFTIEYVIVKHKKTTNKKEIQEYGYNFKIG